jgi:hypothetical protein
MWSRPRRRSMSEHLTCLATQRYVLLDDTGFKVPLVEVRRHMSEPTATGDLLDANSSFPAHHVRMIEGRRFEP